MVDLTLIVFLLLIIVAILGTYSDIITIALGLLTGFIIVFLIDR